MDGPVDSHSLWEFVRFASDEDDESEPIHEGKKMEIEGDSPEDECDTYEEDLIPSELKQLHVQQYGEQSFVT